MRKINKNILQVFLLLFCTTVFVGCTKANDEELVSNKSLQNINSEIWEHLSDAINEYQRTGDISRYYDNIDDLDNLQEYKIDKIIMKLQRN